MKSFWEQAQAMKQPLIDMRRHIHENAEWGDELPETTRFVMDKLKVLGLEAKEICKSGVSATIKGGKPGKTILLRADMDALPMKETNGLTFASKTAYAHTCGHDMHTAMLLGAAKMLYENRAELCGNVKLMFQPGEEIFIGAEAMIKAGIMTDPHVDAAFDMHVMTELPLGCVACRPGFATSSCDGFKINIKGVACHGAQPQNGIDPINVGAHMHLALQALLSRETPPPKVASLTVCEFSAGNSPNIIPETAMMQGTMRTFDRELRAKLYKRFKEIVEYTAKTFGAEAALEVLSDVPSIVVDEKMLNDCLRYINGMGYNFSYMTDYLVTASDDFARVSEMVPSVFLTIGAKPEDGSKVYPNHNSNVVFNEDCLPIGAAMFAQCAFEWLKENA
jgi:amidohydrolase